MSRIDTTRDFIPVRIAVLTVSDSRAAGEDRSGDTLVARLTAAGHMLADRAIVRDERAEIADRLRAWIAAPGVDVAAVAGEAAAEVGAYGFAPPDAESGRSRSTAAAHGVGLSTHEPPVGGRGRVEGGLCSGSVIAVSAGVADPDRGTVRVGTLCSVTDSGADRLVDHPSSLSPVDRLDGAD